MKALAGLMWASTALEAFSVSAEALVYTSNISPPQSNTRPPSISPNIARLLFAQRLGLSQYHSLEDADESTIGVINTFGGIQQQIFDNDERRRGAEKLLLIVEGVANPEGMYWLWKQVDSSRVESHNCGLWNDRLKEIRKGATQQLQMSAYKDAYNSFGSGVHGHTTILHVSSLGDLTPKDGERYTTALSDLKSFIHHFQMPESHISSTIVIMPASRKNAKRSTTSPYGLYTKPLRIRQQEEPLSAPSTSTSISTSASPSAPEILPLQASTSLLPHGILPVCYLSLESCIAATNNCSGHGTAYKKSGGEIDCFACKCSKTQLTDDEGRVKTVYWGGPACQKKDISVPFFLLAGLTIVLVAAVTWSVGLLFSIGEEELPSVIGAGVTGPRAQK
ncbi:hypothetical protein MMC28_006287 [Mycoblastus sanguinarius]|nr:hypothetical protein [Mycoblastus sanguinarius]